MMTASLFFLYSTLFIDRAAVADALRAQTQENGGMAVGDE